MNLLFFNTTSKKIIKRGEVQGKQHFLNAMIKVNDHAIMKAIALCFKPFLKPEEACIYCNIHRTQLAVHRTIQSSNFLINDLQNVIDY